jgi:hypothetical protein
LINGSAFSASARTRWTCFLRYSSFIGRKHSAYPAGPIKQAGLGLTLERDCLFAHDGYRSSYERNGQDRLLGVPQQG